MLTDNIKSILDKHNIRLLYILTERFVDAIRREYKDKDPEVILDIGSRDLDQSIELRSAFPNARIIAFEPNPEQYKLCYERSKLFGIDFVGCAVSDEEGESDFWIMDFNEGGSSLLKPINVPWSTNISKKVTVPCRRIDNVLKELGIDHVDCVWMDVQGYELKVLKSFGNYLKGVKVIHGEASPNPNYEGHVQITELESYLIQNDFELDFLPSRGHPYGEGDLLCIKKGIHSNLTKICDIVYHNAKESLKVKPLNVALIGHHTDPNYIKRYFSESTAYCIDGIDLSSEESIDESLEKPGVYFDVIIDTVTDDYWNQIRLIRNSARHLAPGGILVIQNLLQTHIERYSFDIWEYMHDSYFFIEKFENDYFVLIRNNLKYGKYWTKEKNSFVVKETYDD
jgi:FkbM family methyltransferase